MRSQKEALGRTLGLLLGLRWCCACVLVCFCASTYQPLQRTYHHCEEPLCRPICVVAPDFPSYSCHDEASLSLIWIAAPSAVRWPAVASLLHLLSPPRPRLKSYLGLLNTYVVQSQPSSNRSLILSFASCVVLNLLPTTSRCILLPLDIRNRLQDDVHALRNPHSRRWKDQEAEHGRAEAASLDRTQRQTKRRSRAQANTSFRGSFGVRLHP
jgi:hypothetical protein